jgi:hypothetical protein
MRDLNNVSLYSLVPCYESDAAGSNDPLQALTIHDLR